MMTVDYKKLYVDTIKPIVQALDISRPFLTSSPSCGILTDQLGGVSVNPQDEYYGDVHYYVENKNLWKVSTFPIPRCATEFGTQSTPLTTTMTHWVDPKEWTYGGERMMMRQHHEGGLITNLNMTYSHFEVRKVYTYKKVIDIRGGGSHQGSKMGPDPG
jgi:beta-mannosidase